MRSTITGISLLALALVAGVPAAAETLTLHPSQDNTLFEESASLSNGSGDHLFVGKIRTGALRRALIRFDVGPSVIPAGTRITGARLRLAMSRTIVGPMLVSLHRLEQSWGEGASDAPGPEGMGTLAMPGDATWGYRFFDVASWDQPGGDFDPTPLATTMVGGTGFYEFELLPQALADLSRQLRNPGANFGWILIAESATLTAKRFDSREHPDPSRRPALLIDYELPGDSNRNPPN